MRRKPSDEVRSAEIGLMHANKYLEYFDLCPLQSQRSPEKKKEKQSEALQSICTRCDFSAEVKQSSQKQEIKLFPAAYLYFTAAHSQHGITC